MLMCSSPRAGVMAALIHRRAVIAFTSPIISITFMALTVTAWIGARLAILFARCTSHAFYQQMRDSGPNRASTLNMNKLSDFWLARIARFCSWVKRLKIARHSMPAVCLLRQGPARQETCPSVVCVTACGKLTGLRIKFRDFLAGIHRSFDRVYFVTKGKS
jgi:hypothetical protein